VKIREFAQKQRSMTSFKVVDFLDAAIQLEAQGVDVIRMEAGQPVFALPKALQQAAMEALATGAGSYTAALGIAPLRHAIARLYSDRYNLDIDPRRIIVTTGSSAALAMVCDLLLNPGDSMLLPDPGYPCNANFVRRSNGTPILIPVSAEEKFQLRAARVAAHWQPNTVGVMVASPSNPTGDTLSAEELRDLSNVTLANGGHLIVDEIYHGLTYGPEGDVSILSTTDNAFVINSFSKYFALPGWRLGWMVVPENAIRPLEVMTQNFYISPPNISQQVALAALAPESLEIFESRREEFRKRRDFLVPALRSLGFDIHHQPTGAFYVYAGITRFATDSEAFCWQMLENAHVAFTPGTDFGNHLAREHVRFSYTEPLPRLKMAVDRLANALAMAP
jgi:aspartate/methionine/tyrosine aminotransferase